MTDDFARLVSSANPASRQYAPASTFDGYPPAQHNASPQLLDPFFDDDDMPDSAFGRPLPMQSVESGLPLTSAAANPAGHSKITLPGSGQPQGWTFDEDVPPEQSKSPFSGSSSFPGSSQTLSNKSSKRKRTRQWKWPWQKDRVQTGERVVALNDFNGERNVEFCSNYVSTSKYNAVTFVPKFLAGEFL